MRRILLILSLLSASFTLFSQPRVRIDSLLSLLHSEKREDTTQVRRYISLASNYTTEKPDSGLYYCGLALELSERLKYSWGTSHSYRNYSSIFKVMGDYPLAWEYLQKARKIFEEMKDQFNLLFNDYSRGTLNYEQGNYPEALKIFLHIKPAVDEANSKVGRIPLGPFLASTYTNLGMPDSGLYYIKKYFGRDITSLMPGRSFPFRVMGEAYLKLNQLDSAMIYFKRSYIMAINVDVGNVINTAIGLSLAFQKQGKEDSCIHYANIALSEAQKGKFLLWTWKAATILANAYEKANPSESIRYYKLAVSINDSINNQQKIIQVQNLKYSEELRKRETEEINKENKTKLRTFFLVGGLATLTIISLLLARNNRHKQKANAKIELAYDELKSTQQQLIQSEKMASLGGLTAGIAHEIQNPLNFVNNFSEVNTELIEELDEHLKKGNWQEAKEVSQLLKDNEEKINVHGRRADAIVKSMLQHSRISSGKRELTDINALVDEYLRLTYHGLRAKDSSFNVKLETDFGLSIDKISIVPQDIGRVLINLINNAFYAVNEKKKTPQYEPWVRVSTKKQDAEIWISIADNGNGIPPASLEKIFQPFFTTKPTGQGTGLGLSLSYDIVKAHQGELKVETKEGEGTAFTIILPSE